MAIYTICGIVKWYYQDKWKQVNVYTMLYQVILEFFGFLISNSFFQLKEMIVAIYSILFLISFSKMTLMLKFL